jgi:hypothetical protein
MNGNRIKVGSVREDGKIFLCYNRESKNGERWVSKETFDRYRESAKLRQANWAKQNPESAKRIYKKYCQENPEKRKGCMRNWKEKNRDRVKEYRKKYVQTKRQLDPTFRLKLDFRCSIGLSFRNSGYTKKSKCYQILGCSFPDLKQHLEKLFLEGMSWENRSEWHIDHIIPLASASTYDDVVRLNHYTNLRPLWAEDNLKKGSKIITAFGN